MDNTPVNKLKCLPKEFDPRSPTIDFDRTPIMILDSDCSSSSQDVSFKSVLDESFISFDMSREDPSPVVSSLSLEIETSCSADMECDTDETAHKSTPGNMKSAVNNEPKLPVMSPQDKKQPTVQAFSPAKITPSPQAPAAKKIIFSPSMAKNSPQKTNSSFTCHMDCDDASADQENAHQPLKVRSPRTPLAMINKQSDSPMNILRAKQWKDFQEEREKRGLMKTENVLPPFKVTPSSVPAKLPVRRRPLV